MEKINKDSIQDSKIYFLNEELITTRKELSETIRKHDSLVLINDKLSGNENYFSEIISTQMS